MCARSPGGPGLRPMPGLSNQASSNASFSPSTCGAHPHRPESPARVRPCPRARRAASRRALSWSFRGQAASTHTPTCDCPGPRGSGHGVQTAPSGQAGASRSHGGWQHGPAFGSHQPMTGSAQTSPGLHERTVRHGVPVPAASGTTPGVHTNPAIVGRHETPPAHVPRKGSHHGKHTSSARSSNAKHGPSTAQVGAASSPEHRATHDPSLPQTLVQQTAPRSQESSPPELDPSVHVHGSPTASGRSTTSTHRASSSARLPSFEYGLHL